jgi:hypothetical protein
MPTFTARGYRRPSSEGSRTSDEKPRINLVRRRVILTLVVLFALAVPGRAFACSRDDSEYYETFVDTTCLQAPLNNTTLDALGGLRLATNGTPFTQEARPSHF